MEFYEPINPELLMLIPILQSIGLLTAIIHGIKDWIIDILIVQKHDKYCALTLRHER